MVPDAEDSRQSPGRRPDRAQRDARNLVIQSILPENAQKIAFSNQMGSLRDSATEPLVFPQMGFG